MQIIATQQTVTARSRLSDELLINYTAERQGDNPAERINGRILKNDSVAGYFNSSRSGESTLTFLAGSSLTPPEKQSISAQVYEDEPELYNGEG